MSSSEEEWVARRAWQTRAHWRAKLRQEVLRLRRRKLQVRYGLPAAGDDPRKAGKGIPPVSTSSSDDQDEFLGFPDLAGREESRSEDSGSDSLDADPQNNCNDAIKRVFLLKKKSTVPSAPLKRDRSQERGVEVNNKADVKARESNHSADHEHDTSQRVRIVHEQEQRERIVQEQEQRSRTPSQSVQRLRAPVGDDLVLLEESCSDHLCGIGDRSETSNHYNSKIGKNIVAVRELSEMANQEIKHQFNKGIQSQDISGIQPKNKTKHDTSFKAISVEKTKTSKFFIHSLSARGSAVKAVSEYLFTQISKECKGKKLLVNTSLCNKPVFHSPESESKSCSPIPHGCTKVANRRGSVSDTTGRMSSTQSGSTVPNEVCEISNKEGKNVNKEKSKCKYTSTLSKSQNRLPRKKNLHIKRQRELPVLHLPHKKSTCSKTDRLSVTSVMNSIGHIRMKKDTSTKGLVEDNDRAPSTNYMSDCVAGQTSPHKSRTSSNYNRSKTKSVEKGYSEEKSKFTPASTNAIVPMSDCTKSFIKMDGGEGVKKESKIKNSYQYKFINKGKPRPSVSNDSRQLSTSCEDVPKHVKRATSVQTFRNIERVVGKEEKGVEVSVGKNAADSKEEGRPEHRITFSNNHKSSPDKNKRSSPFLKEPCNDIPCKRLSQNKSTSNLTTHRKTPIRLQTDKTKHSAEANVKKRVREDSEYKCSPHPSSRLGEDKCSRGLKVIICKARRNYSDSEKSRERDRTNSTHNSDRNDAMETNDNTISNGKPANIQYTKTVTNNKKRTNHISTVVDKEKPAVSGCHRDNDHDHATVARDLPRSGCHRDNDHDHATVARDLPRSGCHRDNDHDHATVARDSPRSGCHRDNDHDHATVARDSPRCGCHGDNDHATVARDLPRSGCHRDNDHATVARDLPRSGCHRDNDHDHATYARDSPRSGCHGDNDHATVASDSPRTCQNTIELLKKERFHSTAIGGVEKMTKMERKNENKDTSYFKIGQTNRNTFGSKSMVTQINKNDKRLRTGGRSSKCISRTPSTKLLENANEYKICNRKCNKETISVKLIRKEGRYTPVFNPPEIHKKSSAGPVITTNNNKECLSNYNKAVGDKTSTSSARRNAMKSSKSAADLVKSKEQRLQVATNHKEVPAPNLSNKSCSRTVESESALINKVTRRPNSPSSVLLHSNKKLRERDSQTAQSMSLQPRDNKDNPFMKETKYGCCKEETKILKEKRYLETVSSVQGELGNEFAKGCFSVSDESPAHERCPQGVAESTDLRYCENTSFPQLPTPIELMNVKKIKQREEYRNGVNRNLNMLRVQSENAGRHKFTPRKKSFMALYKLHNQYKTCLKSSQDSFERGLPKTFFKRKVGSPSKMRKEEENNSMESKDGTLNETTPNPTSPVIDIGPRETAKCVTVNNTLLGLSEDASSEVSSWDRNQQVITGVRNISAIRIKDQNDGEFHTKIMKNSERDNNTAGKVLEVNNCDKAVPEEPNLLRGTTKESKLEMGIEEKRTTEEVIEEINRNRGKIYNKKYVFDILGTKMVPGMKSLVIPTENCLPILSKSSKIFSSTGISPLNADNSTTNHCKSSVNSLTPKIHVCHESDNEKTSMEVIEDIQCKRSTLPRIEIDRTEILTRENKMPLRGLQRVTTPETAGMTRLTEICEIIKNMVNMKIDTSSLARCMSMRQFPLKNPLPSGNEGIVPEDHKLRTLANLHPREKEVLKSNFIKCFEVVFDSISNYMCLEMGNLLYLTISEDNNKKSHKNAEHEILKDKESQNRTEYCPGNILQYRSIFKGLFSEIYSKISGDTIPVEQRTLLLIAWFVKVYFRATSLSKVSHSLGTAKLNLMSLLPMDVLDLPLVAGFLYKDDEDFLQDCFLTIEFIWEYFYAHLYPNSKQNIQKGDGNIGLVEVSLSSSDNNKREPKYISNRNTPFDDVSVASNSNHGLSEIVPTLPISPSNLQSIDQNESMKIPLRQVKTPPVCELETPKVDFQEAILGPQTILDEGRVKVGTSHNFTNLNNGNPGQSTTTVDRLEPNQNLLRSLEIPSFSDVTFPIPFDAHLILHPVVNPNIVQTVDPETPRFGRPNNNSVESQKGELLEQDNRKEESHQTPDIESKEKVDFHCVSTFVKPIPSNLNQYDEFSEGKNGRVSFTNVLSLASSSEICAYVRTGKFSAVVGNILASYNYAVAGSGYVINCERVSSDTLEDQGMVFDEDISSVADNDSTRNQSKETGSIETEEVSAAVDDVLEPPTNQAEIQIWPKTTNPSLKDISDGSSVGFATMINNIEITNKPTKEINDSTFTDSTAEEMENVINNIPNWSNAHISGVTELVSESANTISDNVAVSADLTTSRGSFLNHKQPGKVTRTFVDVTVNAAEQELKQSQTKTGRNVVDSVSRDFNVTTDPVEENQSTASATPKCNTAEKNINTNDKEISSLNNFGLTMLSKKVIDSTIDDCPASTTSRNNRDCKTRSLKDDVSTFGGKTTSSPGMKASSEYWLGRIDTSTFRNVNECLASDNLRLNHVEETALTVRNEKVNVTDPSVLTTTETGKYSTDQDLSTLRNIGTKRRKPVLTKYQNDLSRKQPLTPYVPTRDLINSERENNVIVANLPSYIDHLYQCGYMNDWNVRYLPRDVQGRCNIEDENVHFTDRAINNIYCEQLKQPTSLKRPTNWQLPTPSSCGTRNDERVNNRANITRFRNSVGVPVEDNVLPAYTAEKMAAYQQTFAEFLSKWDACFVQNNTFQNRSPFPRKHVGHAEFSTCQTQDSANSLKGKIKLYGSERSLNYKPGQDNNIFENNPSFAISTKRDAKNYGKPNSGMKKARRCNEYARNKTNIVTTIQNYKPANGVIGTDPKEYFHFMNERTSATHEDVIGLINGDPSAAYEKYFSGRDEAVLPNVTLEPARGSKSNQRHQNGRNLSAQNINFAKLPAVYGNHWAPTKVRTEKRNSLNKNQNAQQQRIGTKRIHSFLGKSQPSPNSTTTCSYGSEFANYATEQEGHVGTVPNPYCVAATAEKRRDLRKFTYLVNTSSSTGRTHRDFASVWSDGVGPGRMNAGNRDGTKVADASLGSFNERAARANNPGVEYSKIGKVSASSASAVWQDPLYSKTGSNSFTNGVEICEKLKEFTNPRAARIPYSRANSGSAENCGSRHHNFGHVVFNDARPTRPYEQSTKNSRGGRFNPLSRRGTDEYYRNLEADWNRNGCGFYRHS